MPVLSKAYLGSVEIKRVYAGAALALDRTGGSSSILDGIKAIPEVAGVFVADPAYLFTDAGTTNVANSGDAVEQWHCARGSGAVLSRIGSGITYQASGGHQWVAGTGNGYLTGDRPPAWKPNFMMAAAVRQTDSNYIAGGHYGDPSIDVGRGLIFVQTNDASGLYAINGTGEDSGLPGVSEGTDYVVSGLFESSGATGRLDGVAATKTASGAVYLGGSGDKISTLGQNRQSTIYTAGRVYALIYTVGVPSAADIATIEQWLAERAGVTL